MLHPRKGIVIDNSTELVIRLQTGAQLSVPQQKKIKLGDTCYVLFNYTTLKVREIWTEDEYYTDEEDAEEENEINVGKYKDNSERLARILMESIF